MKLKYYLRGAGVGIVFATLIMLVVCSTNKNNISDDEIIRRAMKLGMVMPSTEDDSENLQDENQQKETENQAPVTDNPVSDPVTPNPPVADVPSTENPSTQPLEEQVQTDTSVEEEPIETTEAN